MTTIAHLTDLHFGAEDPEVVEGLRRELRADPPDLVAVSGDLTQGARRSEFRAARAFLDGLGVPWLAVPGNHDISPYVLLERFLDPYARWRQEVAPETEPVWQDARCAVVGVNTAHRMGWHWDWSRGRYSHRRLHRLAARLRDVPPGRTRIVVAHHPLLTPETGPPNAVAGGARRALALFGEEQVALVLAGHLHRSFRRQALGVTGTGTTVLQGGSATSIRLRGEPNAYARVAVDPAGAIAIELRLWDGGAWCPAPAPALTPLPDPAAGGMHAAPRPHIPTPAGAGTGGEGEAQQQHGREGAAHRNS